jgi:hypothetical protein
MWDAPAGRHRRLIHPSFLLSNGTASRLGMRVTKRYLRVYSLTGGGAWPGSSGWLKPGLTGQN